MKKYFGKSNCLEESSRILWYCPNLFVFWPVKFFLKNYPHILTTVQAKRLYSSFLKLRTSTFFLLYDRMTLYQNFQLSTSSSFNQSQLSSEVKTAEPCEMISKRRAECWNFWSSALQSYDRKKLDFLGLICPCRDRKLQ